MAKYISKLKKKGESTWYDIFAARAESDKNGNVIASTYYTKVEAQQTVKLTGDQSISGKKKFTGTIVLSANFRGQVGGQETGDLFFSSTAGGAIMTSADMAGYVGVDSNQTITGAKTFSDVITAKTNSATAEGLTVDYTTKVGDTTTSTNAHSAMTLTPQALIKETLTASYTYSWPNKTGTVALTSDIPSLSGYLLSTTAESTYAKKTDLNSYLTTSSASSTYATKSQLNSYLTTSNASSTYLTKTDASNTYLTKTGASGTYLSQTDAQSTYLTQSSASTTYAKLRAENTFTKQQTIKVDGGMTANMSAGDGMLSLQNTYNNTTTTLEVQPSWPPKMTGTRKTTSTTLQYYDYTFPSKTGTLATTADIPDTSKFVTLSGTQTLTGNKTFGGLINTFTGNAVMKNGVGFISTSYKITNFYKTTYSTSAYGSPGSAAAFNVTIPSDIYSQGSGTWYIFTKVGGGSGLEKVIVGGTSNANQTAQIWFSIQDGFGSSTSTLTFIIFCLKIY